MEITYIPSEDYECPYCHGQLEDNGGDEKVCRSEMCHEKHFKTYTIAE